MLEFEQYVCNQRDLGTGGFARIAANSTAHDPSSAQEKPSAHPLLFSRNWLGSTLKPLDAVAVFLKGVAEFGMCDMKRYVSSSLS